MFQKLISMFRMSAVQFQNLRYFCSTFGAIQVNHFDQLIWNLTGEWQGCKNCWISFSVWESKIILSRKKTTTHSTDRWQIVINHQSSKSANFTKNFYNMPTFQHPLAKATRPKAKFYSIYMVAYGLKFKKCYYLHLYKVRVA